jgi:STE24 endopeptidase
MAARAETTQNRDDMLQAQAKRYARIRRRIGLVGWLIDALLLVLLLVTGASAAMRNLAYDAAAQRPLALLVYLLMIGAIFEIVGLPLGFYSEFVIERRFGLSRMTLGKWAKDQLKSLILGAALGSALAEIFY